MYKIITQITDMRPHSSVLYIYTSQRNRFKRIPLCSFIHHCLCCHLWLNFVKTTDKSIQRPYGIILCTNECMICNVFYDCGTIVIFKTMLHQIRPGAQQGAHRPVEFHVTKCVTCMQLYIFVLDIRIAVVCCSCFVFSYKLSWWALTHAHNENRPELHPACWIILFHCRWPHQVNLLCFTWARTMCNFLG